MSTILSLLLVLALFPYHLFANRVDQEKDQLSVSIKDLRSAPTKIVVEGRSLSMSAFLWRDFMPSFPPMIDGKPMIAVLKVATLDKKPFPSGVRISGAWVLFGDQIWDAADFKKSLDGSASNKESSRRCLNLPESPECDFVARDGPKWGPGVFVDVVVRLIDKEGRQHLLQAPKQYVSRTD